MRKQRLIVETTPEAFKSAVNKELENGWTVVPNTTVIQQLCSSVLLENTNSELAADILAWTGQVSLVFKKMGSSEEIQKEDLERLDLLQKKVTRTLQPFGSPE
jgi:hypothetical protein